MDAAKARKGPLLCVKSTARNKGSAKKKYLEAFFRFGSVQNRYAARVMPMP